MTHRTPYGWMVLGGLLCLFGVAAAVKWRDANQARAQSQPLPPIEPAQNHAPLPPVGAEAANPPQPAPPSIDIVPTRSDLVPPPVVPPPLGSDPRPIVIPPSATQPPANPIVPPPTNPVLVPPPDSSPPPAVTPVKVETKEVTEPPLAPRAGPVITFRLTQNGETFRSLARKTLHDPERWAEIHKLNAHVRSDAVLVAGTLVRLPADAYVGDDAAVRQLPSVRPRPATKAKAAFPLTGTFPLTLDDKRGLTLPKAVLAQLGGSEAVMLSPGCDKCLWLTNQAHLDRMAAKLEKSPARESDVQNFKRLYYAQTVKTPVAEGRVVIGERLAQFAGLHRELILVGIDDHFEVWDAARWRSYTHTRRARVED